MKAKGTKLHNQDIINAQLNGTSEEQYIEEVQRIIKENISVLFYKSKLTQKQFALQIGIAHSTLERILNRRGEISLTVICKIGANLGIPIQNIITSNNRQKNPRDEG